MVGESQAAHKGMFGNRGALFQGFGHAYQYTEQGENWSELSKLFSLSRDQGCGEQPVWQSGKLPTAQHPSASGNTKGLHFPPSLGTFISMFIDGGPLVCSITHMYVWLVASIAVEALLWVTMFP